MTSIRTAIPRIWVPAALAIPGVAHAQELAAVQRSVPLRGRRDPHHHAVRQQCARRGLLLARGEDGQLIVERFNVRGQMDGWLKICKAPADSTPSPGGSTPPTAGPHGSRRYACAPGRDAGLHAAHHSEDADGTGPTIWIVHAGRTAVDGHLERRRKQPVAGLPEVRIARRRRGLSTRCRSLRAGSRAERPDARAACPADGGGVWSSAVAAGRGERDRRNRRDRRRSGGPRVARLRQIGRASCRERV